MKKPITSHLTKKTRMIFQQLLLLVVLTAFYGFAKESNLRQELLGKVSLDPLPPVDCSAWANPNPKVLISTPVCGGCTGSVRENCSFCYAMITHKTSSSVLHENLYNPPVL
jgi:hypothetical protein